VFSELSLLEFGSYLECSTLQVVTFNHSSWSLLTLQVAWPDHTFIILSFSFLSSFYFSIPLCSCVHLFYFLSFPYTLFNFTPIHHQHHIIMFSLCPLEVNLHTYLTTWLSSYPVGIFFGFFIIFCLKSKPINKVQPIKMCDSKINSHREVFGLGLFRMTHFLSRHRDDEGWRWRGNLLRCVD